MTNRSDSNKVLTEVVAVFLFALGVFIFASLVIFSNLVEIDSMGMLGKVGVFVSESLGKSFGVSSFVFPVLVLYCSYVVLKRQSASGIYWKICSTILFLFSSAILLKLVFGEKSLLGYSPAGGGLSTVFLGLTESVLGTFGSYIIAFIGIFISMAIATEISIGRIENALRSTLLKTLKIAAIARRNVLRLSTGKNKRSHVKTEPQSSVNGVTKREPLREESETEPDIVISRPVSEEKISGQLSAPESGWLDFSLPPIDLLDPKIEETAEIDKDLMYRKAEMIERKLADFGVSGKVVEIRPGPVITMFEYKPAAGIKINRISSLEGDLAMSLSALSIRIIAPIPGKDVVGIEVPNDVREAVVLRELFENKEFAAKKSMLTIALGKDISGKAHYMDLQTAPHLMIAGTTGSGKSVLLNAAITSLLYRATPYELKMIMIDPKMLELSIYDEIPHLLHPVVTDSKKAVAALRWLVEEMDSRYAMLSEQGVRNIDGFNRKLLDLDDGEKQSRWLPYIVVIIDELADLMMVSPSDVKDSIIRLAQKARAAGIHIIVATQRPSADVVAGLVKANFPARISFLVSSKVDSRIILDTAGAETLLGRGDMLLLSSGGSNLVRLQGAFISDAERTVVTDFLRSQAQPTYITEITRDTSEQSEADDMEKDDLYDEALEIIAESGQASISMIQRKLKIGYNRAARIVEVMEREGVVGPQGAAGKPREVYTDAINAERRSRD